MAALQDPWSLRANREHRAMFHLTKGKRREGKEKRRQRGNENNVSVQGQEEQKTDQEDKREKRTNTPPPLAMNDTTQG